MTLEVFMKLRRAMGVAAATTVLAPLALLSAPAAFATGDDPAPSTGVTAPEDTTPNDSTSEGTDAGGGESPATGGEADGEQDSPSEEDTSGGDPTGDGTTGDGTTGEGTTGEGTTGEDATGENSGDGDTTEENSEDAGTGGESAEDEEAGEEEAGEESKDDSDTPGEPTWDPYASCEDQDWDDKISSTLSGLPNTIVAGTGWHEFRFVVENGTDTDLKDVWVEAYTEYLETNDEDASLYFDLAEIEVKENGQWTSAFQEGIEFDGESFDFSGSFVGMVGTLEKGATVTFDMRVRIDESAPAGTALALSEAVYAGADGTCRFNGEFYDLTVLGASSDKPDDVQDAVPNGDRPTTPADTAVKPQGGVKEITGSLAETGSSSALPMIGLIGGAAVVVGAGAVFAVKRRKAGSPA
ncbi:LAETG motif-containing sortase-dependent surface protein [Streptomyces sp. ZYX-F-203]